MATIDLRGLVNLKIFEKKGVTGKGTEYVLVMANKGLMDNCRLGQGNVK